MDLRRIVMLLCPAALAACQATVVERLPDGTTADCPDEWRGAFVALDEHGQPDGDFAMFVAEDCAIEPLSSDAKDAPPADLRLHPRFLARGNVVLFADPEVRRLLELREDQLRPPESHWPFRWTRERDVLSLDAPDHRRIATLIVNGALEGATRWTGPDEGFNVLRGDAAALRDALAGGKLFGAREPIRLEHVGERRDDAVRAQRRAARDGGTR
jgi:hypothetical protein